MSVAARFDPYLNDPLHWGVSMAQHAELLLACLDAAAPRRVVEVGAYAGDLTRVLTAWAAEHGARVTAIDPAPQPDLERLAAEHPELELVRRASLDALPEIDAEAIVIDGDHNHWTVARELELIAERARAARRELPLLFLHDVAWPHARRDDYFDIEQIPPAARRLPLVGAGAGITPGDPGTRPDGMPYPRSAAREGGPGNGVLTALEEFVAAADDVRLVVVPAFFGFGCAWPRTAPWAQAVEAILGGWDRPPLLERLEANRVLHVAREHELRVEIWRLQERLARQEHVLRRLLESSAFSVAEGLSRLRGRLGIAPAQSLVSRRQVRDALSETRRAPVAGG